LIDLPHTAKVVQVSSLGPSCDLSKKTDGLGFQARLGRIFARENNFNLDLNGILTPLNPAFPFLSAIVHWRGSGKSTVMS
jgi:hypothetical protein